jgi:hypothetical protein
LFVQLSAAIPTFLLFPLLLELSLLLQSFLLILDHYLLIRGNLLLIPSHLIQSGLPLVSCALCRGGASQISPQICSMLRIHCFLLCFRQRRGG